MKLERIKEEDRDERERREIGDWDWFSVHQLDRPVAGFKNMLGCN